MNNIFRDTILEVDLKTLGNNMRMIDEMVGPEVMVMAVIKANGYGLGAVEIADTLMENGAKYLAVATLIEALELRKKSQDYPLFILGHTPDKYLEEVVKGNITQTIFSLNQAKLMNKIAKDHGVKAKVHIKLDTGFHRLGFPLTKESKTDIIEIYNLENLEVEGIFSHFALTSEADNWDQFNSFQDFVEKLEDEECWFKYIHFADSIASVDESEFRLNMVRVGALMYGIRGFHVGFLGVDPAMRLKSKISQIHHIEPGEGVGYDYTFRAERPSVIATVPIGYADGLPRNLGNNGYFSVDGKKAPIIGIMCMDQCVIDVTDIPNTHEGQEVIIYGKEEENAMTIDIASKLAKTNKNEILARITSRVTRVYK